MYEFPRVKRVTDPLDDRVKARIFGRVGDDPGFVSSGSEHSAQTDDDVTSPSLSELFFGFAAGEGGGEELSWPETDDDSDCGDDRSVCGSRFENVDLVRPIVVDQTDEFQNVLRARVLQAVEVFSCFRSDRQIMRRNVMAFLRDCGYNAAVCKTKWPSCGGLTAGNYEFIDVLRDGGSSAAAARYFVDLDFAAEFEIARPTVGYERMTQYLPSVLVAKSDDLKRILMAMSAAAKRSMKSGGLHLPPWRKHRFMQNKWFGPYRRTTNAFPAASALSNAVKCRAVGFDAAVVVSPSSPYEMMSVEYFSILSFNEFV